MDFKKLIAMLLVVILLASMICGCEEEKEAVPSETTLQAHEPETATQGVETEDLQETAAETEADVACFGAYGSICNERLTEYGTGSIGTAQSHSKGKYLSGLSVVRLMDFDADGIEELLLIYMTGFDDTWGWSGCYEIWTYKNGEATQAIASEEFSSGQSGQQELEYLEQDGKIRLIRSIDHSYEMEHPEFRIEAWALNGSVFEQETVVAWKGDGINGKDGNYYYLNGEEISKDQYEVECDKLYNPSVDCFTLYSDFAYEPDEIEKTMEDMLQETDETLVLLGVAAKSTKGTPDAETSDLPTDISIVGEWKIDWDQTQKQTGRYGQEMFGTSVSYGNALVLTSDNRIEYFFSFYGGSGTYQFNGESIAVDATSYEPSICSDLQHLSLKIIDGTLYLYMHLNEVLPDYPESDGLYWKLEN